MIGEKNRTSWYHTQEISSWVVTHTEYTITKQGSTDLGLNTSNSSSSTNLVSDPPPPMALLPTTESNPPSSLSTSSWSLPIRPATTLHTSIALFTFMNLNSSSMSSGIVACALQLVDSVEIPSNLGENPVLMIPQTLQYWWLQTLEFPFCPKLQRNVEQWNLRSSLPSAMHLSSRLRTAPFRAALDFTDSLYSSNLASIFELLWIFKIRWIFGIFSLSVQPVLNMIRTMLFPESPSMSSETACFRAWCCSRFCGFWKTSPHAGHGKISFRRGKNWWSAEISDSGRVALGTLRWGSDTTIISGSTTETTECRDDLAEDTVAVAGCVSILAVHGLEAKIFFR